MTTTPVGRAESPMIDFPRVGFIGLGDQGLPMATAIAEGGFDLHVWARRAASLDAIAATPHTAHDTVASLAADVDLLALCIGTDEDVLRIVEQDILPAARPGLIVVNHGTGTPKNAARLAASGGSFGVEVLDAPVSGGRPAAETRTLTVLVGGADPALARARPVLDTFATHVVHLGGSGSGQLAKLFNNALLMLNQAAIADLLEIADRAGLRARGLVEALTSGSADSRALRLMGTMINPRTVDHLAQVEALDMALFDEALHDAGVLADETTARGLSGAHRLRYVVGRLTG